MPPARDEELSVRRLKPFLGGRAPQFDDLPSASILEVIGLEENLPSWS